MNPEALFRVGVDTPSAWFCAECRLIAKDEATAERCCKPAICADCNAAETAKGWTVCGDCRADRRAARERERFAAARQVTLAEYALPFVYVECAERYVDPDEFVNWLDYGNDEPAPAYAYGTCPDHFRLSAEFIVENGLEGHYEEAYRDISDVDIEALQRFLDEWTERVDITSYSPDYTVVVMADGGGA